MKVTSFISQKWLRVSPVLRLALVAGLGRAVFLLRFLFGTDQRGNPNVVGAVNFLSYALTWHLGVHCLVSALLATLTLLMKEKGRRKFLIIVTIIYMLLVTFALGDLEMLRYLGQHLSLSVMSVYVSGGGNVLSPELTEPLRQDWAHYVVSFVLLGIVWTFLIIVCVHARRHIARLWAQAEADASEEEDAEAGDPEGRELLVIPQVDDESPSAKAQRRTSPSSEDAEQEAGGAILPAERRDAREPNAKYGLLAGSDSEQSAAPAPVVRPPVKTDPLRWRTVLILVILGICGIAFQYQNLNAAATRLHLLRPIEQTWLVEAIGLDETRAPKDAAAAAHELRRLGEKLYLSKHFPLVHLPDTTILDKENNKHKSRSSDDMTAYEELPDIVVVVIESLRGAEVGWVNNGCSDKKDKKDSVTPNMDRFACAGVSFPRFFSQGFPTREGFMSTHCSMLPHGGARINIIDFTANNLDCIPPRLREQGYRTHFITGSNPSFDNQLPWAQKWYDGDLDYPQGSWFKRKKEDRELFTTFAETLEKHDDEMEKVKNKADRKPLFAWIATTSTHAPWLVDDDTLTSKTDNSDDGYMYRRALGYSDHHLGVLLDKMKSRARSNNTVVVVMSDHSYPLSEDQVGGREYEDLPCDRKTFTALFMNGPSHLIGDVRQERFPASQVDVMPTLMHLAKDQRPTASVGVNLLGPFLAAQAKTAANRSADDEKAVDDLGRREAIGVSPWGQRKVTRDYTLYSMPSGSPYWVFDADAARPQKCDRVKELPKGVSDEEASDVSQRLRTGVRYSMYLTEKNRVWHPDFLKYPDIDLASLERMSAGGSTTWFTIVVLYICIPLCTLRAFVKYFWPRRRAVVKLLRRRTR